MKTCTKCSTEKDESEFSKRRNGLHSWCKVCHKTYKDKHYRDNIKSYKDRLKQDKLRFREFIRQEKDKPCTDCGRHYPYYVMDFDHLQNKKFNISRMYSYGIEKIKIEIAKCELVCANCHRIRTWRRATKSRVP